MSKKGSQGFRHSKWLMIGALVAAILMGIGRVGSGLVDQSGSEPVPDVDCAGAIAWEEASEYVDEVLTVRGPVAGATWAENVGGQPTFLNVGRDHPDPERFTVVIWGDVRGEFPERPEAMFAGQEICVAGEIRMHEDSPQIELAGPDAIEYAD